MRDWTELRFNIEAVTVNTINAQAKAEGGEVLDKVSIK